MDFAILGISGKAHSGKSTTFEAIRLLNSTEPASASFRLVYLPLAKKLKEIARELHGWDGDKEIYYNEDGSVVRNKGRQLLIEVGRFHRELNPNVWVDVVSNEISKKVQSNDSYGRMLFVIDDIRFQNEMRVLKKFGNKFVSVRLDRKLQLNLDTESEKDLDNYKDFDFFIENNGTKTELADKMHIVREELLTASKRRIHA